MAGRYFDEWQVGDTVPHAVSRTVTRPPRRLTTGATPASEAVLTRYSSPGIRADASRVLALIDRRCLGSPPPAAPSARVPRATYLTRRA